MSDWFPVAISWNPGLELNAQKFCKEIADGLLQVIIGSTPETGWHLSISCVSRLASIGNRTIPTRLPTWEEIKEARYRFLPDGYTFALLLPPKAEYVNVHPTTMHLFQIADGKIKAEVLE